MCFFKGSESSLLLYIIFSYSPLGLKVNFMSIFNVGAEATYGI